jgi:DNA-binding CsgD family transcriptional regulator
MHQPTDYNLFYKLFDLNKAKGFADIDSNDDFIIHLESKMKANKQFVIIGDLLKVSVLHVSSGYNDFYGDVPFEAYPLVNFERTHPDIKNRHSIARSKFFKMAQDMFTNNDGPRYLSTNLVIKNQIGTYIDLMFQCYLVYSELPYRSVFVVIVNTDISEIAKMKHGYHFYAGRDASYFRFPDYGLLMRGNLFTNREYEIINCIAEGLDSEQIANKLFLSKHTVNTHRRNILHKTGNRNTQELVIDLKQKGVI